MGLFEALNWPLQQAKGVTPGEDWYDRPEGMPHELWAASQVAGDLILDPLNLLPVGLFAKGAKAAGRGAKAALQPGSGKGLGVSSTSNYIPNWYGLTDGSATKISPAEKVAVQALMKKGLPYDQALGAVRKGKSGVAFGAGGVKNAAKNMLSPRARATHKETGMNPVVQDAITDLINKPKPSPRDVEKAAANVNYLSHINQQSGRQGPLHPAMVEIAERSNLEAYADNTPGVMSDWFRKHGGTVKETGQPNVISDLDAWTLEEHVRDAWGDTQKVVMKRARSGPGGNHYNDLFRKMAPIGEIRKGMVSKKGSLADHFKKNPKGENWSVKKIDDDGAVWLQSQGGTGGRGAKQNVGTAVTEGGVNWTMKVDPDGTLMGMVSDRHDFLENMPVAGKAIGKNLPNNLVAVTPPMYIDIRSLRKQIPGTTSQNIAGVSRKKTAGEASNLTLLEELASVRPSDAAVAAEQAKNLKAGGMLSAAPALYQGENE